MIDVSAIKGQCLALNARMAARALTRIYNGRLRPLDLQVTQFSLLVVIARDEYGSLEELADWLALERTTLTRNIQLLEERGLVAPASEKRVRVKRLRLTTEGERVLAAAVPLWEAAQADLEAAFGPERVVETRRALRQLAKSAQNLAAAEQAAGVVLPDFSA